MAAAGPVSFPAEDSPSGLGRTLGKRVGGNPSRVRISHPPPRWPGKTPIGGVGRLAFRGPLVSLPVSVLSAQHHLHGDSPQLFYQVTGVADGPEQEATRRRSVRLAVQGWPRSSATGRIPADV